MMEVKTVGLASDHAGYALKQFVKEYLAEKGYAYKDFGTDSEASCDYADYAHLLAQAVEDGECYPGIAICGSGEGISMTLNKHQGIRAGLSWIPEIAHLCRQHNDANIITLSGRFVELDVNKQIVDTFLTTKFEGGRHAMRVKKIMDLDADVNTYR